jgi:hypothetical protein
MELLLFTMPPKKHFQTLKDLMAEASIEFFMKERDEKRRITNKSVQQD